MPPCGVCAPPPAQTPLAGVCGGGCAKQAAAHPVKAGICREMCGRPRAPRDAAAVTLARPPQEARREDPGCASVDAGHDAATQIARRSDSDNLQRPGRRGSFCSRKMLRHATTYPCHYRAPPPPALLSLSLTQHTHSLPARQTARRRLRRRRRRRERRTRRRTCARGEGW